MRQAFVDDLFHTRLRPASGRLLWLGIVMVAVGVLALLFPMFSTLAVTVFVGWMMAISGAVTFVGAFSIRGTGPFFGALLLGLLSLGLGVFLIANPLAGAVALTLMVGAIFAVQAAFELYFAFEMRPHPGWAAMLISGVAAAVVAGLILVGWPSISLVVLGTLFGVNFASTGAAYIMVSRSLKAAG